MHFGIKNNFIEQLHNLINRHRMYRTFYKKKLLIEFPKVISERLNLKISDIYL